MKKYIENSDPEEYNFKTLNDFSWCMKRGGEVNFIWNGKMYVAFGKVENPKTLNIEIFIGEGYYKKDGIAYNAESHAPCVDIEGCFYKTADEALEHRIDGEKLRDVITKIEVVERTI